MTDSPRPAADGLARVPTGSPAADALIGGGFPRNSINIFMGHPGTGKTVLAEQILFHNATVDERPVVFLSTLSEPLSKVVTYLQELAFYDEDLMGRRVLYEDIGPQILAEGVESVVDRIGDLIKDVSPRILVIDSFKAVHDMVEETTTMRRIVADLGGLLSAYAVTTFLVGEYSEEEIPLYPEFAVADGIVELARRSEGRQDERYLRVLKLRGSSYRPGQHGFRITREGIDVFPRLVTPSEPRRYQVPEERAPTGIDGLDVMLSGGLWRGSSALVVGRTGSGKTTMAMSFLAEGLRRGEKGLFLNFQENPTQLARSVALLGLDMDALVEGGLELHYDSPVELQIDSVVVDLFRKLERREIQRVAVDALSDLALAAPDRERLHDYLYSLLQHLAVRGITSMLTMEQRGATPPLEGDRGNVTISSMVDTIVEIDLHPGSDPWRSIRVAKSRGTGHDLRTHQMTIDAGGIRVVGPRLDD